MAKAPKKIGRYKIEEEVGKGGMAKVYKAYDPNVKRQVALKLMSTHLTDDDEFRARFRREAEAVAALEHVGIVPIYDFGEDDDQLYIVMRLMGGGTLKDRIHDGPISIEEAAKTLRRIAMALDKAHENGIIHRDLKPGNILYDEDGEGYIADFGVAHLAKSGEELTGTGALIGTPAYMSPEQVRGANDEVDGRSDIYSLGVILFEMLSGRTPYNADTPMGTALMHLLEPVPRVLEINPNLPPTVEEIIDKAMAKEKEDRYAKAKDMADALDEVIAGSYMPTQKMEDGEKVKEAVAVTQKSSGSKKGLVWGLLGVVGLAAGFFLFQGGFIGGDADSDPDAGVVSIIEEPSPTLKPTDFPPTLAPTIEQTLEPTAEPTAVPAINPVSMSLSNIGQVSQVSILGRGTINDIAISPDEALVAVVGSLGVRLYDTDTLTLVAYFENSEGLNLNSVAWAPDTENPRLVTGGQDGSVRIWDAETGQQLLNPPAHQEPVNSVDWSPDGTMIASGSADNTVKIWNADTGSQRFTLEGHAEDVTNVSWSPNGESFVSSGWSVLVWNIEGQFPLYESLRHSDQIESLAWSPDSQQLISASADNSMKLLIVQSADSSVAVEAQETTVYGVSWSPDGETIVQSAGKNIQVRNSDMGIQNSVGEHKANTTHFEWLEDGSRLISVSSDGELILWDTSTWKPLQKNSEHTGEKTSAAISPDGSKVASGSVDGIVRIWEAATGIQLEVIEAHEGSVNDIAWSTDGTEIATVGEDGVGRIWDAESYIEIRKLLGHRGPVNTISWSPDGSMIATTSDDLTIRIWNSEEGSEINQFGQVDPIRSLSWSPDGTRVALSSGNEVWIRNSLDTVIIGSLVHDVAVNGVAWSPDGELIATTSEDKSVNLWDADRRIRVSRSMFGHSEASVSVVWSPDSTMIYTASEGGEILVWDVNSESQVHMLSGHAGKVAQIVLLDDLVLVSAGVDGTLRIWAILSN